MKWTREIPTVNGWHWMRGEGQVNTVVVGDHNRDYLRQTYSTFDWLGPITSAMAELWDEMVEALEQVVNNQPCSDPDCCDVAMKNAAATANARDLLTRAQRVKEQQQ